MGRFLPNGDMQFSVEEYPGITFEMQRTEGEHRLVGWAYKSDPARSQIVLVVQSEDRDILWCLVQHHDLAPLMGIDGMYFDNGYPEGL